MEGICEKHTWMDINVPPSAAAAAGSVSIVYGMSAPLQTDMYSNLSPPTTPVYGTPDCSRARTTVSLTTCSSPVQFGVLHRAAVLLTTVASLSAIKTPPDAEVPVKRQE